MIETLLDAATFSEFVGDLWNVLPAVVRLLITAVFAMFIVFGVLKLID